MLHKLQNATNSTITSGSPDNSTQDAATPASLAEALDPKFDHFYAAQPKVSFDYCDQGYIIAAEGPMSPVSVSGNGSEALGRRWVAIDDGWEGMDYERM